MGSTWNASYSRLASLALAIGFVLLPLQDAVTQEDDRQAREGERDRQEAQEVQRTSAEHLLSTLSEAGSFEMLLEAIEKAGLEEQLSQSGPYTVFAPTDAAFREAFPNEGWERVMEDEQMVAGLLRHHIVPGEYLSAEDLARKNTLATLEGGHLRVRAEGDRMARVEFEARRGEGEQERDREEETREDAEAGEADEIRIGNTRVTRADLRAMNGVIHVIDEVLMPSGFDRQRMEIPDRRDARGEEAGEDERREPPVEPGEEQPEAEAEPEREEGEDEVARLERRHEEEVAELEARQREERMRLEAGRGDRSVAEAIRSVELFSEFRGILDNEDELVRRLEEGTYTVLAPTNEAMNRLSEARRLDLREDEPVRQRVLGNHVLEGRVTVDDLRGRDSVRTLGGQTLPVTTRDGAVVIGGTARIIVSDVEARNGLIHSIDTVLLPQAMTEEEPDRR